MRVFNQGASLPGIISKGTAMLTEKAFSDFVWCPTLFRDLAGNPKRLKPDRTHGDDTLEMVHSGLTTGQTNKRVVITKISDGNKAEGYGKDIWLMIYAGDIQLLLSVYHFTLQKDYNGPWKAYATRYQHRKKPREDQLKGEEMVRIALARSMREYFPRISVTVHTMYEGSNELTSTTDPNEEKCAEADMFFHEIQDLYDGERPLPSRLDRCEVCWWNKECPKAQLPEKLPSAPNTGKPMINVL